MNMNPAMMVKLMQAKSQFEAAHPRVFPFFKAAFGQKMEPGTVIEMKVTKPDGQIVESNIRVQQSDLDLFEQLKELNSN